MANIKLNLDKSKENKSNTISLPKIEKAEQTTDIKTEEQISLKPSQDEELIRPTQKPIKKETIIEESSEEFFPEDNKSKVKKKCSKKPSKKSKNKKENKTLSKEQAYKNFQIRKKIIFVTFILGIAALIGFGVYTTFFKEELTAQQAATYTNRLNNQTQVQSWDSGVEGFLQANLKTLLTKSFQADNKTAKDFEIANIAVEKNQQLSSTILISYFSVDIVANGQTNRTFCSLPLSVENNKYNLAGELQISTWQAYSADSTTVVENPFLSFEGIQTASDETTNNVKSVLENFFTLGYNSKQDVSNIYKGTRALDFSGATFKNIIKCTVYSEKNQLGYNTIVEYLLQLNNGATYKTKSYMTIENNNNSYTIKNIY